MLCATENLLYDTTIHSMQTTQKMLMPDACEPKIFPMNLHSTKIVGGTGRTRPPIEIERPPSRLSVPHIEIQAFPHRDLSAGLWEKKVTLFCRKNRLKF